MDKASILSKQAKKNLRVKKVFAFTTSLYLFLAPCLVMATDVNVIVKTPEKPWIIWRSDEQLSVSYRINSISNLIDVKAKAILRSTPTGFICFIENLPEISNWLDNAESAKVISKISNNESIFITKFNGFWPVAARDVVVHSRYWQNQDLSLEIVITDAGESVEKNQGTIRMKVLSAHWKIVPTENNNIDISYQFLVDPKGNIPKWLSKTITLNSIWTTLVNLKVQLPTSACQLSRN